VIFWVQTHPLPLAELATRYGIALEKAASPLVALSFGLGVAFVLVLVRRTRAGFAGVALSFAAFVALFFAFIVPLMNLHQSSREMALEMDKLLPPGEPMPHYSSIRDSALFYTDRSLQLIRNHKELDDLLAIDGQVYCLISASRYREMGLQAPIVYERGDDLLISNHRSGKL
jgi:hypothetical protein